MGKSQKQPQQPTHQQITQTTIAPEFMPYAVGTLQKGMEIVNRPYEAYTGPRIADFSQDTQAGFGLMRDNVGSYKPYTDAAAGALGDAMGILQSINKPDPSKIKYFQGTYVGDVNAPNVETFNANRAREVYADEWGQDKVDQYLSPYVDNVLETLTAREDRNLQRALAQNRGLAAKAGAFGGSRASVLDAVTTDLSNMRLNEVMSKEMQNAWAQALTAFGSDRDAALKAGLGNQQADLQYEQMNLNAKVAAEELRRKLEIQAAQGNQQARMALEQMNLDANLRAQDLQYDVGIKNAQIDVSRAGAMGQIGGQYAGLGQTVHGLGAADANNMLKIGLMQDQQEQAKLDTAYNDFVNQRDYDRQNLAMMAGLIHGMPMPTNSDVSVYQNANPYSQMLGAGIGAMGLYQNMKGA